MRNYFMRNYFSFLICTLFAAALMLTGCGKQENPVLSADSPTNITIWHYYNGTLALAFDELVSEFNNTTGRENGIRVQSESFGSIPGLEAALWDAANGKVGAYEMPDIFQCYQDTALMLDGIVPLVNFDDYITEDEKTSYVKFFLDSGYIGKDRAWKIFPLAKSTEILILNKTDWDKFASETGVTVDALSTWEGVAATAEKYYDWSGGKAFFGRDAFENYLIIASSQLGHEIFKMTENGLKLDFDKETMRKIWDNFYVPYIKGYYRHVGIFRSDDLKLGEIIALVCSTSSAVYFPSAVTLPDGSSYPVEHLVLPLPNFYRTTPYATQQGAGMAVTKSTDAEVLASITFLKWFTQAEQNLRFSANSGYMPVSVDAINTENIETYLAGRPTDDIVGDTLAVSLDENSRYVMYTPSAFAGLNQARNILASTMPDIASNDRAAIESGADIEAFLTDEHFDEWYDDTLLQLKECCTQED